MEKAITEEGALVSSISVSEVAMLVTRGRLERTLATDEWISHAERAPGIRFAPITNRAALRAVELPGSFHPDPRGPVDRGDGPRARRSGGEQGREDPCIPARALDLVAVSCLFQTE